MSSAVDSTYAGLAELPEPIETAASGVSAPFGNSEPIGGRSDQVNLPVDEIARSPPQDSKRNEKELRAGWRRCDASRLASGLLFLVIGAAGLVVASSYPFGSAARMGPGFFPMLVAAGLIGAGVLLTVGSRFAAGEAIGRFRARPPVFLLGGLFLFGLSVDRLGLLIGSFLAVLVVGLAIPDSRWRGLLGLAAGLTAFAWLIFAKLLGLALPVLPR